MTEENTEYADGYKEGWKAGFNDGKAIGYVDAKVRARLGIEIACDSLELPGNQEAVIRRALDNTIGKLP